MTRALVKLLALQQAEQWPEFIATLRKAVAKDPSVLAAPEIKQWCGRRWRDLFITAAADDPEAVTAATKSPLRGRDSRADRQRVAERFIRSEHRVEWQQVLPPADIPQLQKHTLLFAPGLLNGILPSRAFGDALPELQAEHGWKVLRADLHPLRGCEANVEDLKASLEQGVGLSADSEPQIDGPVPDRVIIVGYSKGVPDVLTLLAKEPKLAKKVVAVFSWAGAIGGSFLADDIHNSVKDMKSVRAGSAVSGLLKVINPFVQKGTTIKRAKESNVKQALADLTTDVRGVFTEQHRAAIDALNIPIFNLTGSTTVTEAPYFQMQGVMELNKYDANNDMQVTQAQAKWPGNMGIDLCMLRGHHWDLSYSAFPRALRMGSPNLDHPFPKKAAMLAMMQLAAELGLID